jgi:hypothetical protein
MRARNARGIVTPIAALAPVESDEVAAGVGVVELEEIAGGLPVAICVVRESVLGMDDFVGVIVD